MLLPSFNNKIKVKKKPVNPRILRRGNKVKPIRISMMITKKNQKISVIKWSKVQLLKDKQQVIHTRMEEKRVMMVHQMNRINQKHYNQVEVQTNKYKKDKSLYKSKVQRY